jgi:uncharacterized protein
MATTAQQTLEPPGPSPMTPIPRAERSLAPDIARGGMLLFIALANVPLYLFGRPLDDYNHHADASLADTIALFFEQLLMAERTRPMFAILYGFGMAVMAARMYARGIDAKGARKVLRRRSWWLIAFGALHAMLLFFGDILAPYGATGLIALGFVHLSHKALKRWLWGSAAYVALVGTTVLAFLFTFSTEEVPVDDMPPYVAQLMFGAIASAMSTILMTLLAFFIPLVIAGIMIQRAGWIDHPEAHLTALRRVFVSGMAVNLASSLPIALIALGVWHPSSTLHLMAAALTVFGGMYAGLGYICGFALLAHRWRDRGSTGVPGALAALGKRSLTGYLGQSIIMAPLLTAWGLGLGDGMGYLPAFGIAFAAWLITVAAAVLMERRGWRGPFEVLLRRLTYGKRP